MRVHSLMLLNIFHFFTIVCTTTVGMKVAQFLIHVAPCDLRTLHHCGFSVLFSLVFFHLCFRDLKTICIVCDKEPSVSSVII